MIVSLLDAPLWIGLTMFCLGFVGISCLILVVLRRAVRRMAHDGSEWDRVLSYAVGAYGVFYGVTLALIAAASYATYADVDQVPSTSPRRSPCCTAPRRTSPSRSAASCVRRSSRTRPTWSNRTGRSRHASSSR